MCKAGVGGAVAFCALYAAAVAGAGPRAGGPHGAMTWLQYIYTLSYIKLAISTIKYMPQVI